MQSYSRFVLCSYVFRVLLNSAALLCCIAYSNDIYFKLKHCGNWNTLPTCISYLTKVNLDKVFKFKQ